MSNVSFTNLAAVSSLTTSDQTLIVQSGVGKRATVNDVLNAINTAGFSSPLSVGAATQSGHAVNKSQLDAEATARASADATLTTTANAAIPEPSTVGTAADDDVVYGRGTDGSGTRFRRRLSTMTHKWLGGKTGEVARPLGAKLGDTVSVKDFGAKGDGVTDDTAAIQAAINYAETLDNIGPWPITSVFFPQPAPCYRVTSTLFLKRVNLIGLGYGPSSCWIGWDADGGTCIKWQALQKKVLTDFWFDGINGHKPTVWVDCTYTDIASNPSLISVFDFGDIIHRNYFGDCKDVAGSSALILPEITNARFRGLRFGGSQNPIVINQPTYASGNRVVDIDDWTIDAHGATLNSLIKINMTGSAGINLSMRNGRIETTGSMGGVKAMVEVNDPNNNVDAYGIRLSLINMDVQISNNSGVSLLYHGTNQGIFSNMWLQMTGLSGINTLYGGTWGSFWPKPAVGNPSFEQLFVVGGIEAPWQCYLLDRYHTCDFSTAATTPGSVVKKMQVYDSSGTSLGYVPIYSSIT